MRTEQIGVIVIMLAAAFNTIHRAEAQIFRRACPGGVCARQTAVHTPPFAVEYTPRPCESVNACAPVVATEPAPCDPVTIAAPEPCAPVSVVAPEPCAPVAAEPAPCDPVQTCEGADCAAADAAAVSACPTGVCPIRAAAPVRTAARTAVASVEAAAMLVKINALRARYGLRALTIDNSLQAGAEASAAAQARAGRVFHQPGCGYEICAANTSIGVDAALNQWVASAGHRQILLGSQFTRCGVATVRTASGRNYCVIRFF